MDYIGRGRRRGRGRERGGEGQEEAEGEGEREGEQEGERGDGGRERKGGKRRGGEGGPRHLPPYSVDEVPELGGPDPAAVDKDVLQLPGGLGARGVADCPRDAQLQPRLLGLQEQREEAAAIEDPVEVCVRSRVLQRREGFVEATGAAQPIEETREGWRRGGWCRAPCGTLWHSDWYFDWPLGLSTRRGCWGYGKGLSGLLLRRRDGGNIDGV